MNRVRFTWASAEALGPELVEFLRDQAKGIVASHFFIAEAITLKTRYYVLFFIELLYEARAPGWHLREPDSAWATRRENPRVGSAWRTRSSREETAKPSMATA